MAVSRADLISQTKQKKELYSDFLDSFAASPVGGNLAKVTNENSVRQSIKNLILTNLGGIDINTNTRLAGERLFQPLVGSDVNRSLFEQNNILTETMIINSIESTIKYNEPRAKDIAVSVLPTNDEHYLIINILFSIINNPVPIDLTLNLRRVR
jgi:phage baseplate assembly protein W